MSRQVEHTIEKIGRGKWRVDVDRGWSVSYNSHPRHRLEELPRFLEGNRLTKDNKETDSQRQKLYDAQRRVTDGRCFSEMEEVANAVVEILRKAWWQRRYGSGPIVLRPGSGARRANAKGNAANGNLNLPKFGRCERTILHELIHLTVPKPHAGHGRLYASRYLEAVSWWLGPDAGDRLREGYREENVRWHPRRKLHADHMSAGAKRKMREGGYPDWADPKKVRAAKGVRPLVVVA